MALPLSIRSFNCIYVPSDEPTNIKSLLGGLIFVETKSRANANVLKLKENRIKLNFRKNFLMIWKIKQWNSLSKMVLGSSFLDVVCPPICDEFLQWIGCWIRWMTLSLRFSCPFQISCSLYFYWLNLRYVTIGWLVWS